MSEYVSGRRSALETTIGSLELEVLDYEITGGYIRKVQPQIQGMCAVWDTALRPSGLKLVCESYMRQGNIASALEWLLSAHANLDIEIDGVSLSDMILLDYSVKGGRSSPKVRCELEFGAASGGGVACE